MAPRATPTVTTQTMRTHAAAPVAHAPSAPVRRRRRRRSDAGTRPAVTAMRAARTPVLPRAAVRTPPQAGPP
eukprot:362318-Chlamydomonas_euryale.AAC.4